LQQVHDQSSPCPDVWRYPCQIGTNAAGMSPQGRPKGEYRSPQGEGTLMSPQGRPKGRIPQCAACRLPDKPRRRGKTPGYNEYDHAPQP
jgi:hypothetical protein